jgi:outer membrane biosynthesis protein TonB
MKQLFKTITLIFTLVFFVVITCEGQIPNKSQVEPTQTEEVTVGFQCPDGTENESRPEIKLSVGDVTKKAKELPKPKLPSEAKAAGVFGKVVAEVAIDIHSGKVVWARIVSGHPLLREAVKAVVCQARFYPSLINSAPIKVSGKITYSFRKS